MILRGHVNARGLGKVFVAPVDCILESITVVQPDIVFVETARRSIMSERGIEGAPTLVVEVISPSTGAIDRRRKLQLYARYAVPNYWIVDPPARTIGAHVPRTASMRRPAFWPGPRQRRSRPLAT